MNQAAKRRKTKVNVNASRVYVPFDLTITGEECKLQQNSQSLEESGHLIQLSCNDDKNSNWKNNDVDKKDEGDGSHRDTRKQPMHLLVDRYDARAMMDELSLQQLCHLRKRHIFNTDGVINKSCLHRGELQEEGSREEIYQRNIERFGMLPAESQPCTTVAKPDVEDKNGNTEHHDTDNKEINDGPFEPTEEQRNALPNGIILPRTMRQHNIIELTATRVANNPQLEIFLKLKQSNNTYFSFINPAAALHPYYLHLKGKCSGENEASDKGESPVSDGKSGLDGLLAGYSSEDTDKAIELKEGSAAECTASIPQEQKNDGEQNRKAERLERLRQWKESKNLQTTTTDNDK
jgi:hypothetical protein